MTLTRNLEERRRKTGGFDLLDYPEVTDAELIMLAEEPLWDTLYLDCTEIDTDRLKLLRVEAKHRRRVNQLWLYQASRLSDPAIEAVAWMFDSVNTLSIYDCSGCTDGALMYSGDIRGLTDLSMDGAQSTGIGLANLRYTSSLRRLTIASHNEFNSAHLVYLAGLSLNALSLMYSNVRMDDLRHLLDIRDLTNLDLTGIGLNDAGLDTVCQMVGLESLKFEDTKAVTNSGFAKLASLSRAKELIACCPNVTDDGAAIIAGLTQLERLRFSKARVTVRTIQLLPKHCPKLTSLGLEGCEDVTDDVTETLCGMTGLRRLSLRGTKMTAVALAEVRAALPRCEVRV